MGLQEMAIISGDPKQHRPLQYLHTFWPLCLQPWVTFYFFLFLLNLLQTLKAVMLEEGCTKLWALGNWFVNTLCISFCAFLGRFQGCWFFSQTADFCGPDGSDHGWGVGVGKGLGDYPRRHETCTRFKTSIKASIKKQIYSWLYAYSESCTFSSSHVQMWGWTMKTAECRKIWCFQVVVLKKTLESPLDSKEIKRVNPKGNQPWIFIGRTDAKAEAPILWPPHVKNQLIGKDVDAGKDWRRKEKRGAEAEVVR